MIFQLGRGTDRDLQVLGESGVALLVAPFDNIGGYRHCRADDLTPQCDELLPTYAPSRAMSMQRHAVRLLPYLELSKITHGGILRLGRRFTVPTGLQHQLFVPSRQLTASRWPLPAWQFYVAADW